MIVPRLVGSAARAAVVAVAACVGLAAPVAVRAEFVRPYTKVPEPVRLHQGTLSGETPDTLMGATPPAARDIDDIAKVINVANFAKVVAKENPLILDVSQTAVATAPGYKSVPGAALLPGAGSGTDDKAFDDAYKARIAALTGGDIHKPIMVFSHPDDWSGYNAAKRLVYYGYKHIRWYRDGVEGWAKAGNPTAPATPDAAWMASAPKQIPQ